MKKAIWIITVIFCLGVMGPVSSYSKQVYVKSYTKKDGTHVRAHYRNYPASKSSNSPPKTFNSGSNHPISSQVNYKTHSSAKIHYISATGQKYKIYNIPSSELVVYRWIDSKGVTCFSDSPPFER
ncbi:DUF4124 domain-containing protein [Legionella septentrionalis]|uniref:DUF4124 domain-containing protein n=1 Tax=Legionella septentrionalis TaxID=2498109 RepID=A0A3S0V9A8_9GAMM|nr:DUF4124 domain-containing protein [Legionella septentrionalis]RUQ78585.1 DUF4124 domain-containing protein [Legionella septentrionalis]